MPSQSCFTRHWRYSLLNYLIPQPALVIVAPIDPTSLGGEDISILDGDFDVTPNGDWATVRGKDAGRQSILRESVANPGEFVRRPDWGVGLSGTQFKGATAQVRDEAVSRQKTRLAANPRVRRTISVTGQLASTGLRMTVVADTVDGRLDLPGLVFKP
jgi:hypothetical protein